MVVRFVPAVFVVPARVAADFDAAAFDGARFGVVLGADAFFADVVVDLVLVDPELLMDRLAFLGELPVGNTFPTALPALEAAPPTALPALVAAPPTALPALTAAPPTAFPAVVAAPPTALPGPDEATDSAALLTVPAALPTVFPTFLLTRFRSLPVSGMFVLLIRPPAKGGRP